MAKPGQVPPRVKVDPGAGVDMSQVEFSQPGYSFDADMPTRFRTGAAEQVRKASTELVLGRRSTELARPGEVSIAPRLAAEQAKVEARVFASGVRQLAGARRSGGRVVQRRVGWKATPEVVVVTVAERELVELSPGRMKPVGDWLVERRETWRSSAGEAVRRTGRVRADDAVAVAEVAQATQSTGPVPGQAAPAADAFPEGSFATSFLPRQVRSSLLARVPSPKVFDGTAIQYSRGSVPDRLEVNVIRMDDSGAVVVQATRAHGSDDWEVAQAVYSLSAPEVERA